MSMPIDRLLDQNENRYEQCVAAMKISKHIADNVSPDEDTEGREKIAVQSIRKLLEGDVAITAHATYDDQEEL